MIHDYMLPPLESFKNHINFGKVSPKIKHFQVSPSTIHTQSKLNL